MNDDSPQEPTTNNRQLTSTFINHHSLTASKRNSITTSQLHTFTASQLQSVTASQLHSFTAPQLHNFTTAQLDNFTASQLHTFTASQLPSFTPSQLLNFASQTHSPKVGWLTERLHLLTSSALQNTARFLAWRFPDFGVSSLVLGVGFKERPSPF